MTDDLTLAFEEFDDENPEFLQELDRLEDAEEQRKTEAQDCGEGTSKCKEKSKKRGKKRRKGRHCTDEDIKRIMEKIDKRYGYNVTNPATPPLQTLRHGVLSVTAFASVFWCEQQYVYSSKIPRSIKRVKMPDPKHVKKGKEIHRERELEIQKYKPIKVTSREDHFSVKHSNTLSYIRKILSGRREVVREVSVCGEVFGVPLVGIVDELRSRDEGGVFSLELVEFKTRVTKQLPGKSQRQSQDLQVMIYKKLVDDMIRGSNVDDLLSRSFSLDFDLPLNEEICKSLEKACRVNEGRPFSEAEGGGNSWTLRRLFSEIRLSLQCMPLVNKCYVSYSLQETQEQFQVVEVTYDEAWLNLQLEHMMEFWRGERGCAGVPIEEAHKCSMCHFQDNCAWVRKKTEELTNKNKMNVKKTSTNCLQFQAHPD